MAKSRKPAINRPFEVFKNRVSQQANEFIDAILKPTHIKPPPTDNRYSYLIDIYSKWHLHFFYICSKYCSPAPNAISPQFEHLLARMEYMGHDRFNLSYKRYNGQWILLYTDQSLEECFDLIKNNPLFNF